MNGSDEKNEFSFQLSLSMEEAPVRARTAAFAPLHGELVELRSGLDGDPTVSPIQISPAQYAAALDELLEARLDTCLKIGVRVAQLDLDEPGRIGSSSRRALEREVGELSALVAAFGEVAGFRPYSGKLPRLARAVVARCLEIGAALLEVLVATTEQDVAEAREQLQNCYADLSVFREYWDAIDCTAVEVVSASERVARALGRDGEYCDELDFPDLAKVLGAFSSEDEPFPAMTVAGGNYLQPLLRTPLSALPPHGAFLVIPVAMLASLSNPHYAIRVARQTLWLLRSSGAKQAPALVALIRRGLKEQPLILEAQARIRRDLTLLALAEREGIQDDADVISRLVTTYRRVLETSYRTVGHLVLGLSGLEQGGEFEPDETPPLLADLEARLTGALAPGPTLAAAVDRNLRNAEAHEQYRYDAEAEVVEDLRMGISWSLDEMSRSFEELVACVHGVDIACSCYIVDEDLDVEEAADETPPQLAQLFVRTGFDGYGFRVEHVDLSGGVVRLDCERAAWHRLLPPLAGAVRFFSSERAVVLGHGGRQLVSVDRTALLEPTEADGDTKELATFAPFVSAAIADGVDEIDAYSSAVAAQLGVVITINLQELAVVGLDSEPPIFERVRRQLAYVSDFRERASVDDPRLDEALEFLDELDRMAAAAASGELTARENFLERAVLAMEWAEETRDLLLLGFELASD